MASEEREAIDLVAADVVPAAGESASRPEPPTVRLGLPGFDEVAVVDHRAGSPEVVVTSAPGVAAALTVEACRGEGPSTEAVGAGELVVCRDLEHERRWPAFSGAVLGSRVALRRWVAVPLGVPGEAAIGSVVLASVAPGIVTPSELSVLGALADRWSLALTARLAAGREARAVVATDSVRVVGLAVGVLMASEGLSEPEALELLRGRSEESGSRLADAAVALLSERRMSFR
ncbi:ANTAR domain-containing protein [Oryzobacter terrae]|uniref:GAF and ANTAR domain-containing protein n=1 Tax=Oryzobacter terrae TaxID=1620385 RepID=UPI00366AEEDC